MMQMPMVTMPPLIPDSSSPRWESHMSVNDGTGGCSPLIRAISVMEMAVVL